MRVSTAAQFRVSEGNTNVTTTKASVKFLGSTPTAALSNDKLVNNPNKSAGVSFKVEGAAAFSPVTTLNAGVNATFYLDEAEPGQQLQVLTRDGRQILGQALTETEKFQLLKPANGFAANANYSSAYLNKTGQDAYRDLDLFYGAKATVLYPQNYDQNGLVGEKLPIPAALESGRITNADFSLAAGALNLNNVALSGFVPDAKTTIKVTGLNVTGSSTFNFQAVVGDTLIQKNIFPPASQNLADLASDLGAQLSPLGLAVTLKNNGQDMQITDDRGREISGVSLTPTTSGALNSVSFGTGNNKGFSTFVATIGGHDFKVDVSAATSMNEVTTLVANALHDQDKQSGLSVTWVPATATTGQLQIADSSGRSLSNVQLISKDLSSGATGGSYADTASLLASGSVQVTSPAQQVANWMNGVSVANVITPTFGTVVSGSSFTAFDINVGGVAYSVDLTQLSPNNVQGLAVALQQELRKQDGSANLSVRADAGNLTITDAAGRKLKDVGLTPLDGSDATAGTVKIENSTLSQTNVQASVFSEVRVPVAQLQLSKPLILNGQVISGYKNVQDLVKAINQSSSGLRANVVAGGELVIENPQGGSIRINSTPDGNALNTQPGTYSAQIRLTQVVRDMRVSVSGVDYKKPLQINGVNLSESVYDVPTVASSSAYQIDFGYPVQSVSGTDAETLANAINSRATISGIQFPAAGGVAAFSEFEISVAGKRIQLTGLTATNLADLKTQIQAGLNAADGAGSDVHVDIDGANNLVFSDVNGRALIPAGLTVTDAGRVGLAKAGQIQPVISQTYQASVDANQRLVIRSLDGHIADEDIANAFVVKSSTDTLTPQTSLKSVSDLMTRINARSKDTGVVVALDDNGDLQLSTVDPSGMADISIGPGKDAKGQYIANALGIEPLDYSANIRLKNMLIDEPYKADIRLTFGSYTEGNVQKSGDPSQLAKVGFRTGAYVEGGCPDDLLVFVTGKGSANVSVGYSGEPSNVRDSLRSQSLVVKFTAADRYVIKDAKTGTELADRHYDPSVLEPLIDFNGLQIKLSHAPSVGDSYTIDGNYDGLGNNMNILDMVDLNKTPVSNGKTIADTYIDQINTVGNLAEQANITQQALTVVNDQAIAARDKISGVNLDEEAAALIRYQQAYQSCAKALKV